MKRYRYRTVKLFHITLWCIILLLSLNVFVKCIRIFGLESGAGSTESFGTKVISSACNYILQSRISITDYISNSEAEEDNNFILNAMLDSFSINQYIAAASNITDNNLIEDQKEAFDFAYDLLFNNDLYVKLILTGIENSKKGSTETAGSSGDNSKETGTDTDSKEAMSANVLKGLLPIDIISGEVYLEEEDASEIKEAAAETLGTINGEHFTIKQLLNRQFLYNNFYIVDSSTETDDELFDADKLLGEDMTMKTGSDKPQILIYHTHSQEAFSDSKAGEEDTVVGLGTHLAELLEEKYGYNVIHDKSKYDIMGGTLDRNLAYNYAREGIEKILKENPSIEVVIDIHRDGAESKRVAQINGKDAAKIMLFNGLSRNSKGEIKYLKNPFLQDNLAFSLQVQLQGREKYPGLMYKNYLKPYRYNMHERKKSLLAEVGTNKNTIEEAMNSMDYLADILNDVFKGQTALN